MATITLDKTTIKAGETAVVTFTVEKTHFMGTLNRSGVRTVVDVTIIGGTISAGYDFRYVEALSTPTTQVYQGDFTPTPNLDRTECRISYNPPGTANDATSATFIVDTRAPTLTGTPTIDNRNLIHANQVTTISFVFSEQLDQASFTTADLTIPAGMGRLENLRTTDGGRSWQVDLRPPANLAANTEAKDLQIGINMAGITDIAGNPGTGNVNLVTYNIDNKPPSIVSVVGPSSIVLRDTTVTITFTFSEAVTGFTLANINLDNSSASPYWTYSPKAPVSADGGRTWTISYRASPHVASDSTNTVSIRNLDGVRDLAGHAAVPNSSASTNNYEVDALEAYPISATFDKTRLAAGETATVTVTFNESVSNVTRSTFQIANGSVSDPTPVAGSNGTVWTATFTPTANLARTTSSIRISLDGLRDSAGNVSNGGMPFRSSTIVIDTKRPEVTVAISDERLTAGETATVTFTFSESVTGFDLNDVQYDTSKGTLGALTAVGTDGRVWSATYTPHSGTESADNTIRVNLAGVLDAQGNAGTGSGSSGNFSIDTKPPEVTVTISDERLTAGETATVLFTFSKSVTGFDIEDIQYDISKGTLGALTAVGADGRVWSATYTPRIGIESADNTIRVNLGGVQDVQGNAGTGTGSSGNFRIDTRPPEADGPPSATIAVTPNPVTNSNDRLVTVTITFDEAVTGFTPDNIDFSNAHVTPYGANPIGALNRSTDGRTYTITYTAAPDVEDATNTISLRNLDTIRDATGNAVTASPTSNNFAIDTKDPEPISATFDKTHLAAGETATVTVTFNEIVNNVTEDTFQIPNGSVSNLRQDTTDGRIWKATFTPTANLQSASSSISIDLNGLRDSAGNVNNGSQSFDQSTISIDTKRPEVTVGISDNRLIAGQTATIIFTFSERVTGFGTEDIQYDTSKGTLSALTAVGADGMVWTATYTPRSGIESADNTIRVNLAGVLDAQGNAGAGTGSSGNFSIDTKTTEGDGPPEVTMTISDERLTAGETATITFIFSESVTGFGTEDIQYDTSKGTLGALTAVGTDGRVWTATYTPRPDTESANNTIRVNLAGVLDAQGNAGEGSVSSGNFSIDTRPTEVDRPPEVTVTISDTRLTAGETATVTFTFSERVTGFDLNDVQYDTSKGTLGALTAVGTDGRVWTATYTPSSGIESANNTIRVNLAGVQDVQGNAGTGTGSSGNFSIDTRPPEVDGRPSIVSVVGPTSIVTGDTDVTITFTFSEAVTGFTLANINLDNSSASPYITFRPREPVSADGGRTWTITFRASPHVTGDSTNTVSIRNLDGVRDLAGNAAVPNSSASTENYEVDAVAPYPTSATFDKTHLAAGETATVTVTFNEIVDNVTEDTFEIPNGSVSNVRQDTTDGRIWRVTFTPTANLQSASSSISISQDGLKDSAGNVNNGTQPFHDSTISIDTKRPEVTVGISDERLTAGETATITITFSERVTGFDLNDVQYDSSKGTLGALTAVGTDGRVWTATYTPSSGIESAKNTIRVNLAGVLDAQGNAGTGTGSSGNFVIDTRPTVVDGRPSIVSVVGPTSIVLLSTDVTITFTFSEAVTGFTLANINLDNSSASPYITYRPREPVSADGGRTWTITFRASPHVTGDSTNTVSIRNLDGVRDLAGNAAVPNSSASTENYEVDAVAPYPTSATFDKTHLAAGETATVTVTFNEIVNNVTEDAFEIPNGSVSNLRQDTTDGRIWRATFTPTANLQSASSSISIIQDGLRDSAGNVNNGSQPFRDSTISIDTKRPEVTVAISDNRLTAGETATVTFTFSERVTGFDLNDVQYDTSKGTLGALTAVGTDGRVWIATYTPSSDTESADNTIRVNLAGVLDAQGNAGDGTGSSGNFSIDTKSTEGDRPPEVTVAISDERLTAGETATVTFTFSESVTGFDLNDVQYDTSKGTLSALTAVGTDGRVWSATYTPSSGIESANNTIRVNLAGVLDAQGNAGAGSGSSGNFSIDTRPPEVDRLPEVTVTISDERLTAGETATVTFTFSERVTGFDTEDIQYDTSKGTLGALTAVGTDGKVWSATYTPSSGIESANNTIRVNLAGVLDAQGNAGVGSASSGNFSIDTRPTEVDGRPSIVSVVGPTSIVTGDTDVTITFTFSEAVTGFTLANINLDNSSASPYITFSPKEPVSADGGRTWTITYRASPHVASDSTNTVSIRNLDGVRDLAGNAAVPNSSASTNNYEVDAQYPYPTSATFDKARLTAGETATVTVTFNEIVNNVTEDAFEIPNGSVSNLRQDTTDGRIWRATFTPTANLQSASSSISIIQDGIRDSAGNVSNGSQPFRDSTISIDTKRPEVTVGISDNRLSAGETATVTFTFTERVTGFGTEDIQYDTSKGTLSALTAVGTDGRVWTATYTPSSGIESATNTIRVNLAGVQDAQGNAGAGTGSSGNFSIDTRPTVVDRPPEVTVTISDERLTAGETATVTFTFSESVTGFDLNDVQYDTSKGTLGALTAVGTDGRVWTATYTPSSGIESATNTIRVNLGGVQDAQGNAGTGTGSSGNFSIDTRPTVVDRPPEVTVTISDERLTAGETATVTFTFSERVTGFDLNDVQYDTSKGTLGALTAVGTDGRVWTATYTPSSGIESATNTIRVNLGGVQDAQGNAGVGTGSSGNFSIDTRPTVVDRPPEVTVTISDERLTAGETATVTFTFSERVTGFTKDDIDLTLANGTLGDLVPVGTDGKVWSATYTPNSGIESATNTIRVNLAGVLDAQGNAGTGTGSSGNFSIDTKPPEATVTISDNHLSAGETATVTFTFRESVTGFGTEDIQYDTSKGTLSALTAVGTDGKVWTATYTPRSDIESADNTIRVNLAGVLDTQGNIGAGSGSSGNFSIDTRPTVVDRPPSATIAVTPNPVTTSNDRLVTVTITFDEAVTGFTVDNIDFSNANVTPYGSNGIGTLNRSADGRTYTITYTAGPDVEDATNTISLRNLSTIRDATGNAATVSPTSSNFAIDTKEPVPISATFDKTHLAAGETATVTVTFNEIVNNVTEDTFQIPNGSVSNLRQDTTDGRIWRATFTPTANLQSTSSSISIIQDGLRDSVGNVSNGSQPFRDSTIVIDTKRPEVTVAISDNRLSAGETATVTFTFSERVTGFDTADIQYDTSKGTLGALTAVGTDGRVWSATYTPSSGIESATNTIRVNLSGVQDAQGNAGVGTGSSGNFSIDTRPTVVDRPPE
ncbi:Ig-like domain-containing protein, partial [Verminephrobacter eiseniae]|uniref:Ig-like domain-containing protein n=3 Tax=Verminephrobacter eiseniae TaxID=364317 RepID=UPI0022372EAD